MLICLVDISFFLSLFNCNRIETHFPLVKPFIIFFYWKQQKIMKFFLQIVFHLISRQRDRFMYIRNKNGPNLVPWGTYALTSAKEEDLPLDSSLLSVFQKIITASKVSKYGFFSGPCFPVFSMNTEI